MHDYLFVKIKYLEKDTSDNFQNTAEYTYCPLIVKHKSGNIFLSIDKNIKWTCNAYPLSNIVFSYQMKKNEKDFDITAKYLIKNTDKNYYTYTHTLDKLELLNKDKVNEALIELFSSRFMLEFMP